MNRRGFLLEAAGLLAASAIVRVSAIMPVKALPPVVWGKIVLSGVDVSGNPDVTMTDEGFYHFPVRTEDTSKFAPSSVPLLRHTMRVPEHLPSESGHQVLITPRHDGWEAMGPLVRKDSL